MRRMLLTAVAAVAAIALAAPGAALAHGNRHHARHHHRARHARVLTYRAARAATPATPATPAMPSSGSEEAVGTIASFKEEVLTITLNDGSTVSGKVTEKTQIECAAPATTAKASDFGARDQGQGDDNHGGGWQGPEGEGWRNGSGDGSGCPGHQPGAEGESSHCTTAALVPGAKVKEAVLVLTGSGAVWAKVEL
jgi:hypothetical protein